MKNIHVIPTSSPSKIFYIAENFHLEKGQLIEPKSYHNVYITSDEEIKEDNWGLSKLNEVILFGRSYNEKFYKKIILTTDQDLIADGVQAIDDSFLEWFVKNPSCEFVETVKVPYHDESGYSYLLGIPQEEPKQDKWDKLNKELDDALEKEFGLEEPKQERLEEVAERLCPNSSWRLGFIEGAKWQAERTFSFNSNFIPLIIEKYLETAFISKEQGYMNPKEWLEQFKKK